MGEGGRLQSPPFLFDVQKIQKNTKRNKVKGEEKKNEREIILYFHNKNTDHAIFPR